MSMRPNDRTVILILDGDAITLTGTAAVLQMAGHECHCAQDYEAALKVLRSQPIDLMICDMNIRGASGLVMSRDLRHEAGCLDVPVMFVSANQIPDIIRRVHEAGGAYYLRKPFDPSVLVELVDKALWMPHLIQTRIRHSQQLSIMPAPHISTESRANLVSDDA